MSAPKQREDESDEAFAVRWEAYSARMRVSGRESKARQRNGVPLVPDLPGEEWRSVVDYEGFYLVSNMGRAKGETRLVPRAGHMRRIPGVLLKMHRHSAGYWVVDLRKLNVRVTKYVHRLVLEAFVGPAPEGMECRHLNGDPSDARLVNLAWGTHAENMADKAGHGTLIQGEMMYSARYSERDIRIMRTLSANGVTNKVIGMAFDAHPSAICQITNGSRWKGVD